MEPEFSCIEGFGQKRMCIVSNIGGRYGKIGSTSGISDSTLS